MYIDTQESGICRNKECELYQSCEQYDLDKVKIDKKADKYYYECYSCKGKVYVE